MSMRTSFTEDAVRVILKGVCHAEGSQYQWATKHKLSPAYVSDVIKGRRLPGPSLLKALKLERVVLYRKEAS